MSNEWVLHDCYDIDIEEEADRLRDAIDDLESQCCEVKEEESGGKTLLYHRNNLCIHCGKQIPVEDEICSECFVARTRGEL